MTTDNRSQLSEPEWSALNRELNRRGVPLTRLVPIRHAGGICKLPNNMDCNACGAPIALRHYTAITDTTTEPGAPMVLNAAAKCPHCSNTTAVIKTFLGTLQLADPDRPARPSPAALRAERQAMRPSPASNCAWLPSRSPTHSIGAARSGLLDLVAMARHASASRGETYADRARPLRSRLSERLGSPDSTPSFLISVTVGSLWATLTYPGTGLSLVMALTGGFMGCVGWGLYEYGLAWSSQATRLENRGPQDEEQPGSAPNQNE